ncbi:MAG TPA: UbiH/UbiF family hydroxylase [Burkholderiales bacterium]|nr:UbiH/UbiF family hydroxylase [Burkholderiales bacterium]
MSTQFDVLIVGGGLVGGAFALALAPSGLSVALVEPRRPAAVPDDGSWDSRIYSISPGAAALFESCGVWQHVPAQRMTRVEAMHIYGDDRAPRLTVSAYDMGLAELAFIVENRALQAALWQALASADHVRMFCPAACTALAWDEDAVHVHLQSGEEIVAQLVVGADGADSWVRTQAGIAAVPQPYGQLGVVANFNCSQPHRDAAYQWFLGRSVLALLPLPGHRVSMVWSTPEEHARELLDMRPETLAEQVAEASGYELGGLETITAAQGFPLKLQRVARLIQRRVALVGDAAHNVHPLAGQGVNLGFRDARELAHVLAQRGPNNDCGDYYLLRRYERARREDIVTMQLTTDGLQKLFGAKAVWIGKLRNFGLNAVDQAPPLKKLLVQQAIA